MVSILSSLAPLKPNSLQVNGDILQRGDFAFLSRVRFLSSQFLPHYGAKVALSKCDLPIV
jgi:hypothetical protein